MTTHQDIEKQIQKEMNEFGMKVYDGELPEKFLSWCSKMFMIAPAQMHNFTPAFMVSFLNKKRNDEVTFYEVGQMINLIFQCSPKDIFDSMDEYLKAATELKTVYDRYNKISDAFRKVMDKKKKTLLELSGVTNAVQFPGIAKA